jgi:peptidyl-prolyl cis-trans isomerase B (cyclophilin B)
MKSFILPLALTSLALSGTALAAPSKGKPAASKNPVVIIKTNLGTMKAEIFQDKVPGTAENFLKYVDDKFYDGIIFHRVVKDFVDQAGGFDEKLTQKPTREPIKNEALAELKNVAGTLSMARTMNPNSATSQFYINVKDNPALDHRDDSPAGIGYCVFGKIIEGADVYTKINQVQTGAQGMFPQDVPVKAVVIESIRRSK